MPIQCFYGNCYAESVQVLRASGKVTGLLFKLVGEGMDDTNTQYDLTLFNSTLLTPFYSTLLIASPPLLNIASPPLLNIVPPPLHNIVLPLYTTLSHPFTQRCSLPHPLYSISPCSYIVII